MKKEKIYVYMLYVLFLVTGTFLCGCNTASNSGTDGFSLYGTTWDDGGIRLVFADNEVTIEGNIDSVYADYDEKIPDYYTGKFSYEIGYNDLKQKKEVVIRKVGFDSDGDELALSWIIDDDKLLDGIERRYSSESSWSGRASSAPEFTLVTK